jgi:cytochrome c oxidase subunit 1
MSHGSAPAGGYLGGGDWVSPRDHKRIAVMYLVWTLGVFVLGLIYAILMKLRAASGIIDSQTYQQMLTQHGLLMVFLYLVPAIPSILGHFVLPLQLGARNMAMPGLSLWGFRFYALGTLFFLISLLRGAVATGWTMVTPNALTGEGAFALLALGLFCVAVSWFLNGLNILLTVHLQRRDGMGFFDLPLFAWGIYLAGYLLTAVSVLFGIIIMYLWASRATGGGLFGPEADPLLWQNYFWFVTTPAAYFAVLPAVGVISEVVAGMSRRKLVGYRLAVGAMIALLAASFVTWGVRLLGSGQDEGLSLTFAALNLLPVLPAALLAYLWLATLHRGAVACAAPTTYLVAFLLQAGIGAGTGLFFSNLAVGSYLANTVFFTAHSHYLMMGGVMTALLAGLHYWWPKMTGRLYRQGLGRFSGMLYLVGLNLAFVPQLIQGVKGVPRGVFELPAEVAGLEMVSAAGMWVMITGLVLMASNLFGSLHDGPEAPADPWGTDSLEWSTPSPPPAENFAD